MKYLIKTEETYRADSEKEAQDIINNAKADVDFTLNKYSSEQKTAKVDGEEVEYYAVKLVKVFDDMKCPMGRKVITFPKDEDSGEF